MFLHLKERQFTQVSSRLQEAQSSHDKEQNPITTN